MVTSEDSSVDICDRVWRGKGKRIISASDGMSGAEFEIIYMSVPIYSVISDISPVYLRPHKIPGSCQKENRVITPCDAVVPI